jgi:glucosamine--fructose-6-phosphate aminotransferase (isomerizing)
MSLAPNEIMLKEIRQQPEVLERTLAWHPRSLGKFRAFLEKRRPRLVVIVARGTSDNAAQFGRYLIEIMTGIPVSLAAPSVHSLYGASVDYKDALVVGISQSGESTDISAVLEQARKSGAMTVGITNEPKSTLANMAQHVFLVRAGREKSVAATKTYTGQLMSLYLLAHALGAKIRMEDLEAIPETAHAALALEPEITDLAGRYSLMRQAAVVARGLNYANAFEFALKMMETSYVVAERFSAADFLHGPIAIADHDLPIFLFGPAGPVWASLRETLEKLREMKAKTVIITDRRNKEAAKYASAVVRVPLLLRELYTPIPYIIPAQLFAAALAGAKGLNADQPRGLRKVTQNL